MPQTKPKTRARGRKQHPQKPVVWELRLYVLGQTPKSIRAFANLKVMCRRLKGRYKVRVIDLLKHPQLARGDQIVAIPTLVRKLPSPFRKFVGDLSNTEEVLVGLNLQLVHPPISGKPV